MTIRRQCASTSCRLDQGLNLLRHQQREIAMYKNHGLRWLAGAKSREFLVKTAPLILGPGKPCISYRCRRQNDNPADGRALVQAFKNMRGHMVAERSEEHTSELQSLMRISYAVFCFHKKTTTKKNR